jgi:hypothetical protein
VIEARRFGIDAKTWRRIGWFALLTPIGVIDAFLVGQAISWIVNQPNAPDWIVFQEAAHRAARGEDLYLWNSWYHFRWSPLVADAFVLVAPLGLTVWRLGQVAAVLTLPDRRIGLLAILSWPFWFDVETGNTHVFTFVLAVWALRGSRGAALGYLGLLVLVPRPLAMPVAAWLLWKRPNLRLPFLCLALVAALAVIAIGAAGPWIGALIRAEADVGHSLNFSPSTLIGPIWIPIGLALAAVFVALGRLGWASLAASPYLLPYYLIFGLLEFAPVSDRSP